MTKPALDLKKPKKEDDEEQEVDEDDVTEVMVSTDPIIEIESDENDAVWLLVQHSNSKQLIK